MFSTKITCLEHDDILDHGDFFDLMTKCLGLQRPIQRPLGTIWHCLNTIWTLLDSIQTLLDTIRHCLTLLRHYYTLDDTIKHY